MLPPTHAFAILGRGAWIPGVIDPACLGSSQVDGKTLMDIYRRLGLKLQPADNAVERASPKSGTCWYPASSRSWPA